jgi:trans-2,3-dihydro-3-hydroxyanthranilate isomerase
VAGTGLAFEVVDVFTDAAFAGNPLAVVLGAEGLTDRQLQAIAREFNLSETAFPLQPDDEQRARGVDYRLRIFTPRLELPFAGHPSVGTAWLLAARGLVAPGRVVQACGAGELPLRVAADGGGVTLTGGAPHVGEPVDAAPVLAAVGLRPDDLTGVPTRAAGTGTPFIHLHVRGDALARAEPDLRALSRVGSVYVVSWGGDAVSVRARMFAPDLGVPEDPATGSAALGLAVQMVCDGLVAPEGTSTFTVLQGVEMGRPSTLHVAVDADAGRAVEARVTGNVVPVSTGRIAVPPR